MKIGDLKYRMERDWVSYLEQFLEENIFLIVDLNGIVCLFVVKVEMVRVLDILIQLCDREKIFCDDVYCFVKQLFDDLGELVICCEDC